MNVNIPFVENQGQNAEEVSYYAKTFYGTSYITQDSITHQIQGKDNQTLVLKEQFLDSNGNPISFQAQGEEPSPTQVSYLKGNDPDKWKTNLPTYNLINLGEIYPGIVVKLRAKGSNIEKLFFISPGSNPENIRIQIQGADQLETDEAGQLNILATGFEQVSMSPPKAYQDQDKIEVKYQTHGNTYQFQIGNYNQQKQLIIDPTLQYSTYLGGTGYDNGTGIAIDNNGNAYITGHTSSTDFPVTPDAYQANKAGGYDGFVAKFSFTIKTVTQTSSKTSFAGKNVELAANVKDDNGNPVNEGQVQFSVNGSIVGTADVVNGQATYNYQIPRSWKAGTYPILAEYLGTGNYQASSGTATLNVKPKSSLYLTITGKKNISVGETVTYTLKVGNHGPDTARDGDEYYAVDNKCPHLGGDLSQGVLEGVVVTCPVHHSQFDLSSGQVIRWTDWSGLKLSLSKIFKSPRNLKTYPVKLDGDKIMVSLE